MSPSMLLCGASLPVRLPARRLRALVAGLALLLAGCNPLYLSQAVGGQWRLVREREPVAKVIADPRTDAATRRKLAATTAVLDFAHQTLGLPDNGSYRHYVALDDPYVVWNVFAAPPFSLRLRNWCFPVAGCVSYRGYFREADARQFAAQRRQAGDDVHVGGAVAYSTLGFFRDPLLSSVLRLPETSVAALTFHELAHQQLYVRGDTVFNESFATLVEEAGVLRWLEARGDVTGRCRFLGGLARRAEVRALLEGTRRSLSKLYSQDGVAESARAARKAVLLNELRARYRALRAGWPEPPWFDAWFGEDLNNASLGALAAYDSQVGALRVMLDGEGGNLPAFYRRAARLGALNAVDRAYVLAQITRPAEIPRDPRCY